MGKKNEYNMIGRYMDGAEVTGYQLSVNGGASDRYDRETVCYLVGKGQISNCTGQISNGNVILRGVGITIDSLPVVQEKDGSLSRTDNIARIPKNSTPQQVMDLLTIVGAVVAGKRTTGYVLRNNGGATKQIARAEVLQLASDGRIANAKTQLYNGNLLLRGIQGCDLGKLPTIEDPQYTATVEAQKQTKTQGGTARQAGAKQQDKKTVIEKLCKRKREIEDTIGKAGSGEYPSVGVLKHMLGKIATNAGREVFSMQEVAAVATGILEGEHRPEYSNTEQGLKLILNSGKQITKEDVQSILKGIAAKPIDRQLDRIELVVILGLCVEYLDDLIAILRL